MYKVSTTGCSYAHSGDWCTVHYCPREREREVVVCVCVCECVSVVCEHPLRRINKQKYGDWYRNAIICIYMIDVRIDTNLTQKQNKQTTTTTTTSLLLISRRYENNKTTTQSLEMSVDGGCGAICLR